MNRAAATALVVVACLAISASASAAMTATSASAASTAANRRADKAALTAYETYLQALVADKPDGVEAETLFASDTSTNCYKALEPIETSTTVPTGTDAALTSIGNEIGADAGLEFLTMAVPPMTQLATTLSTLHWGTAAQATTVKRFLTADEALMALEPSDLCSDALSVASQSSDDEVTAPPTTVTFLTTYQADSALANTRLTTFVKLLDNYATVADRAVAAKIDLLAVKVNTLSTLAITSGTKSLFKALGIPEADTASVRGTPTL
jgi:hypothetical protein